VSEDRCSNRAQPGPGNHDFHLQPAAGLTGRQPAPAAARRPSRFTVALSAHHLMVSLGLYPAMPVLALVLSQQATGAAGPGLFCYSAAAGLGALLMSRWLARRRYRPTMIAGTVLAAVGFGLLPYAGSALVSLALLLAAGLGMSVHSLLSRVLVAELIDTAIGRQRFYSILMIAINIAASIGPFLAMFTYRSGDARPLFTVVAGCYLLAGISLLFGVPANLRAPAATGRWPISLGVLRNALRDTTARSTVVTTLVGTFLYAQFESSLLLLMADQIPSPPLRAVLLAAPAAGIVLLQAPATAVMTRLMHRGTPPFAFIGMACLGFGGAMLLLGSGLPAIIAIVAAIVAFTLAEPLFHSMVSTAFAGLSASSRLEMFNLRQICWTSGEALGSLCGGTVFLLLHRDGHGQSYWLALGTCALVITAPLIIRGRHTTTTPA
jgi:MFS family permease